ncbi:MAG: hypothetical protein QOF57_580 [Frankiaceae bacterium]|nr:hypothetical protein [Frankiaceae bacterium]
MTTNTETLDSAIRKTTALIAGVRPDQRELPTPCPEMNVGQLVDHLVGWLRMFAARATETPYAEDPRAFRAGADPAGQFAEAGQRAVAGFRARSDDSTMHFGPEMSGAGLPAPVALGMMIGEYLGHGWDLAVATGQVVPFTDAEAEVGREVLGQMLLPEYRGPGKSFGYEVAVPDDATPMDRFLGFIGRQPRVPA